MARQNDMPDLFWGSSDGPRLLLYLLMLLSCVGRGEQSRDGITLQQACDAWYQRAVAHAGKGEWAAAERELAKTALAGRGGVGATHLHAYTLYRLEQYSEAAGKFDAVLESEPQSFAARFHLGLCLYELKHYAKAAEQLERSGKSEKHEADALWYPEADGKALGSPRRGTEVNLRLATVYLDWGRALMRLKLVDSATPKLDRVTDLATRELLRDESGETGASFLYLTASALQGKEVFWNAQEHFEAFARRFPTHPKAPRAAFEAVVCVESGSTPEDCLARYEGLIKKHPESEVAADSLTRMGLYHFNNRRYGQSASVFERYVKGFPSHAAVEQTAFKICLCYVLDEKFKEAGECFERFLESHPKGKLRSAAYYWATDCYLKADETEKRNQVLDRFEKEFPHYPGLRRLRKLSRPVFDRILEVE